MTIPIADRWFEIRHLDQDITHVWEPHVDPLVRCNIWHVRGGDRDMIVDSGMGLSSLREAARALFEKSITAVATHTHYDHVGGLHEFSQRIVHKLEAGDLEHPARFASLFAAGLDDRLVTSIRGAGYEVPERLLTALPREDYDMHAYRVRPAPATRLVEEGDMIDLGKRRFEVMHLPGHSPGSIGLWESATGTLFSGDAVYDGPLLDDLPGSDIHKYISTMKRLRDLPVTVVHGGHEASFGRARLGSLVDAYLKAKDA
jgi:glyoxylase-like metal-dependent hydrolase (beta-lactamase superfamily II)